MKWHRELQLPNKQNTMMIEILKSLWLLQRESVERCL